MPHQRIETRKPTLQDEWDVVRAAQHMRELHGEKAAATAEQRARNADDLIVTKRWLAIAATIKKIDTLHSP